MQKDDAQKAVEQLTRMQARVGKAAARVRGQIVRFPKLQASTKLLADGKYLFTGLAGAISLAIDRPGVAPTRRPTNADGGESFHFDVTTVSKGSPFTRLAGGDRPGAAAAHEAYIERDGAADHIPNVRRSPEAEENLRLDPITEAWAAPSGQRYIERPGAPEQAGETLAIYSNIAQTFDERVAFWEAVERYETPPKHHTLKLRRDRDQAFWDAVAADPDAPREFRAALDGGKAETSVRITDERAVEIYRYAQGRCDRKAPAAVIAHGQSGQTQTRIIVELPYELSATDRFDLLKGFCDKLLTDVATAEASTVDLPFCAVIHAPDMHNDPRNSHAHIAFSKRPAALIAHPETGAPLWDFEYAVTARDGHKHVRTKRPFAQNRVRAFESKKWIFDARALFAQMANEKLAERGIAKRLDPRSYKDMGLDIEPRPRVSPKEYISEKRGEPTKGGEASIRAQWDRLEADLDRRHSNFKFDTMLDFSFDRQIEKWKSHPVSHMLTHMKIKWRKASVDIKELAADAAAAGIVITKIRSRLDPPLKSKTPPDPVVAEFLEAATEALVVAPRRRRRELIGWRRTYEKYLDDIIHVRGPVITNAVSVEMHSLVQTVHPHKLAMIDHMADMTNFFTASIRAGHEPDIATLKEVAAELKAASPILSRPPIELPTVPPPQPQAAVPTPPSTAVAPAQQPAALQPAAVKPPTQKGPQPGDWTPFKSTFGRFLVPSSVIFERARQALEAESRIRKDDP